jgi:hypothetical protein
VLSLHCMSACNVPPGDFVFHSMFRMGFSSKGYLLIRERFLILDCLKILSSGQQCLAIIRAWASVPRIISLRASSALQLFELGLRSLELFSLSQQGLCIIRAWASVPRIVFFRPAVPSNYSGSGFGPSSYLLRASSASVLFGCGCQSLELSFSGQQRLSFTRIWVLTSSFRAFRPSALLFGLRSLKSLFRAINALRSKYPNFWWQYTSSDAVCQI